MSGPQTLGYGARHSGVAESQAQQDCDRHRLVPSTAHLSLRTCAGVSPGCGAPVVFSRAFHHARATRIRHSGLLKGASLELDVCVKHLMASLSNRMTRVCVDGTCLLSRLRKTAQGDTEASAHRVDGVRVLFCNSHGTRCNMQHNTRQHVSDVISDLQTITDGCCERRAPGAGAVEDANGCRPLHVMQASAGDCTCPQLLRYGMALQVASHQREKR